MPALGEEFRSAREARGLSLSDVAERLHIRSVYLAAIEDEDWKAIGAPVYVRGFMRTYARFLGMDAEDAVTRFSASAAATTPAALGNRSEERPRIRDAGDRRGPSVVAIAAVLVAIAVVGYVGYAYLTQARPAGTPVAVATPDAAATEGPILQSGVAEIAPAATPTPHAIRGAPKRGLSVRLTQTSWLRITIDGTVAAEGTFPAGTAKSFRGSEADVRLGNAGGVELAVNGHPVGSLGASGDVVERHFRLGE